MTLPISLKVLSVEAFLRPVHTRMPFRYGAAKLVQCPHLTLRLIAEDERGVRAEGLASDNLPPRWFDKDTTRSYTQELEDQRQVIARSMEAVLAAGAGSPFDLWWEVYQSVSRQARMRGRPALLAGFGPSLIERALNDAAGKILNLPLHTLLQQDLLGFRSEPLDPEISCAGSSALVPDCPLQAIHARHTVGLSDPLTTSEVPAGDRLQDGLPQALDEVIRCYGVHYFKIKTQNHETEDISRLEAIARVLDSGLPDEPYHCTLDGNEQYESIDQLHPLIEALRGRPIFQRFRDSILFIEQPLNRHAALDPERLRGMTAVSEFAPVIIDESDDSPGTFAMALSRGYAGVSHKNCKGLFKTLLNLGRIRKLQAEGKRAILSAEDLTNIGTVALQQDLCALSSLGVTHAERNGHHYFRGLSHLTREDQRQSLRLHPDLYTADTDAGAGTGVRVQIANGEMSCRTLHQLPGLGALFCPNLDGWTPLHSADFAAYLSV